MKRKAAPEDTAFCVLLSGAKFLNFGGLTDSVAQIVQLRSANLTFADQLNVIYTRAVNRERTLNANAVRNTANGERLADTAIALGNHGALKRLQTLARTFDNLDEHPNGITNVKMRHILAHLLHFTEEQFIIENNLLH